MRARVLAILGVLALPLSAGGGLPAAPAETVAAMESAVIDPLAARVAAAHPALAGQTSAAAEAARAWPPAGEPAAAGMLGLLFAGGGEAPLPAFHYGGRGTSYRAGGGVPVPTGYRATTYATTSPIILDLGGLKVPDVSGGEIHPHPYTFTADRTALFDVDADGFPDFTEWVGPTTGILCTTPTPASGADLLGTAGGYRSGFERLRLLDTGGDGAITGEELTGLFVWQDADGDAEPDEGEVHPVGDHGIESISTAQADGTGTFTTKDGASLLWDWWPTYVSIRPSGGPDRPAKGAALRGVLTDLGGPAGGGPLTPVKKDGALLLPAADLEAMGVNWHECLLACLSPAGDALALIDHAPKAPHLARVWLIESMPTGFRASGFPTGEERIDGVVFDGKGARLLLVARRASRLMVVTRGKDAPRLHGIEFVEPAGRGFRVAFGAPVADKAGFLLPGWFRDADGAPLGDCLASLRIGPKTVSLKPAADLAYLSGDGLPDTPGIVRPGFAVAADGSGDTLYALKKGRATPLLSASGIGAFAVSGKASAALVMGKEGDFGIACGGRAGDVGWKVASTTTVGPELANRGRTVIWVEPDWVLATANLLVGDARRGGTAGVALSVTGTIGPLRVAAGAPMAALQTDAGIRLVSLVR